MNTKTSQKNLKMSQLTFFFLTLVLSSTVFARPEYPDALKELCETANRLPPVLNADICSTCHETSNFKKMTPQKTAFLNNDLSIFCPTTNTSNKFDYQLYDAKAPILEKSKIHEIELTAIEQPVVVAKNVNQTLWTFNGKVPGPVIRVKLGDKVRVRFINPPTNQLPHSVDFHSSQVAWNDEMTSINPGEEKMYEWTADYAGVWMYHCGSNPALHHIASGMYGMVIVEPKGGLPKVDHEFALVQSEFHINHTNDFGANMSHAMNDKPDYVVFNGVAFQYKDHPIKVGTGKKVRFFVLNAGPSEDSAFHIVGTIFNRVIKEGVELIPNNKGGYGSQAVDLAPAQGAIIELTAKEDGLYPIVTHAFNFVGKGALGLLQAGDGDPKK
ncbi:MAG: multicopper oxidase domain-containing protein [Methylococcaceae bacterium]